MRVVMIGTGYVGLVSGTCFADFGHDVVCVDNNPDKIERLKQGEIPIFEPGLDQLVSQNVAAGRLSFVTDPAEAVGEADVVFIAVGTPTRRGSGYADLQYVYAVAEELAPLLRGYTVVVNKSTVPVGTGDEVEEIIRRNAPDADFDVASNPEFLREGAAIEDFKRPDRVVIGTESPRAEKLLRTLYRPLNLNEVPILATGRRTAELTKYAANAFLAVKIGFINEISDLCDAVGANVQEVARGIGLDKRIGSKFLHPGPGYGGSCFPKDVSALVRTAREAKSPVSLIEQVEKANLERKIAMGARVESAAGGSVRGRTIAVLGVTFKPNTDDMREAPSLVILPMLQARGATVHACDPQGRANAEELLPGVTWFADPMEAAAGADIVLVLTEWNEFRALDLKKLRSAMKGDVLVDLRNVYAPKVAVEAGFSYRGVGRGQALG